MDLVFLIRSLPLFFLLFVFSFPADAAFKSEFFYYSDATAVKFETLVAACKSRNTNAVSGGLVNGGYFLCYNSSGGNLGLQVWSDRAPCPAASTYDSNLQKCVCASGALEVPPVSGGGKQGYCVANTCPPAGTLEGDQSNAVQSSGGSDTVCLGSGSYGCGWTGGGSVPQVCANGKCYTFGPFKSTGKPCDLSVVAAAGSPTPTSAASSPVADADCVSKNMCPGQVNGKTVCVSCSTKTTTSSTSSAASGVLTSASGVSTGTGTTIGDSKSTTTCAGNYCSKTTTTTVTNPDGSKNVTESQSYTDKPTFCAQNPNDQQCAKEVDESSWGGSCGAFSCDGDAVQCATAQASWQVACATDVSGSEGHYSAGESALSGTGHFKDSGTSSSFSLDGFINQHTGIGPAQNCPDDYTINLPGGKTYAIPFSKYCTTLNAIGLVGNGLTMLAAMMIVFGGSSSRKD